MHYPWVLTGVRGSAYAIERSIHIEGISQCTSDIPIHSAIDNLLLELHAVIATLRVEGNLTDSLSEETVRDGQDVRLVDDGHLL